MTSAPPQTPSEEGPPPLGLTPGPQGRPQRLGRRVFMTPFVEVPQPAKISGTVVCARLLDPSHETKADTLNHIALGAHASRHAMVRVAKGQECCRHSTYQTARLAISRGYAEEGQVPESTLGLVMRAWGFGRCMPAYTRAIWRKKFGSDAHLLLPWPMQKWKPVSVVISRNRGQADLEMCWYPKSCAARRKEGQKGRVRTCYPRCTRAHL